MRVDKKIEKIEETGVEPTRLNARICGRPDRGLALLVHSARASRPAAAVILLRRHQPNLPRPYRIWLYPAPLFLAGVGWTFVYCTLPLSVMLFSVAALIGAVLLYSVWRKGTAEPGSPPAS